MEFSSKIWSTGNFIPHGHCYLWQPELVWLHILSDSLIALAYFSIAIALVYFIQKREDIPYPEIFVLFSAFILACGMTHLMEIWTVWHPTYWLSGLIKAITAGISLFTAWTLAPLIPSLLAIPSQAKLEAINQKLKAEIQDRQAVQEALKASQKRLSGILEIAQDAIISVDENQIISMFNQGAEKIFGYQASEVLGQSLNLLLPERYKTNHQNHIRKFFADAEVSRLMSNCHQIWGVRKDGTEFPAEASISKLKQNNEIISTVILHDVTLYIQAQEQLNQQQKTLRAILDNSPIWIWMTDINGKIKFVNNTLCKNLGIPESRFLEVEQDRQFFTEKEAANIHKYDANYWENDLPFRHEKTFTFIDGQEHNLEVIKVKIKDDANEPIGLMSLGLDITESKQARQKLQESEAKFRQIARHEELLNRLANQIRNSLDLDTILDTTVYQVRTLLKVERCHFVWYRFGNSLNVDETNSNYLDCWEIVNESKAEKNPSLLGRYTTEKVGSWAFRFLQLEIIRVDDISLVSDTKMHNFVVSLGIISFVSIPIKTQSGKIGVLICAHHTSVRNWDDSEVELLKGVTDQLAIAIDQAELYNQSREVASQAREQAHELSDALKKLQQAQAQLIQTEKMSSLGQMVAGIAHEINNPINFISANIIYVSQYAQDLLSLIHLYQQNYPHPPIAIREEIETIELDFLIEDLPKILNSMKVGANRIGDIVLSLRNFSRLDESEVKSVDIHEGIDSTLLILQNKLKEKPEEKSIQIIKDYDYLPNVECYVSQINQVFMNIISNAIDALAEKRSKKFNPTGMNQNSDIPENLPTITISTKIISSQQVRLIIADNGMGMTETVRNKIFDPFFTTKTIGSGTGLGLSISYQIIVEKHQGRLDCTSIVGQGTKFIIEIPILQRTKQITEL